MTLVAITDGGTFNYEDLAGQTGLQLPSEVTITSYSRSGGTLTLNLSAGAPFTITNFPWDAISDIDQIYLNDGETSYQTISSQQIGYTIDSDYNKTTDGCVYKLDITIDGAGIAVSNLAATDNVKLPGELSVCTYNGTSVTLGDGTKSAAFALSDMTTQFGIYANGSAITRAETLMTVTNTAEFDGTANAYGFRYNITAKDGEANTLVGGAYADTITGGNTASTLKGGAGVDTINAGSAGDSIYGGTGNDILAGGTGEDKFYFAVGDGEDTLTAGETDAIYITDEDASVAVAKDGTNLVISYGADAEHRTNTITINGFNFAKTSAGAIDTIHIGAEGTFSIPENLAAFDVVLADTDVHTCSIYKENISIASGSATVNGMKATDNIVMGGGTTTLSRHWTAEDGAKLTLTDTASGTITINGYFGNHYGKFNGGAMPSALAVTLDGYATAYTCDDNFMYETISGTGSVDATTMGAYDQLSVAGEITYERTNTADTLLVNGTNDITLTNFNFADKTGLTSTNVHVNGTSTANLISAQTITVTLTEDLAGHSYAASVYNENISVTDETNVVTITGLTSDDNLNLNNTYALSRTAALTTLTITDGNKKIAIPEYDFSAVPAFNIAGAAVASGAALAVTADANYGASNVFTETITLDGANRVITNLAAADTLKLPGALTTCTYDGTDVILGDGTNSAKLTLAAMETQFVINANNAVVSRAATEMAVTNTAEFDGTAYGFRYNITAVADTANTLIGGAYADTITGGNTASTLKGGAGVDTINAGSAGDSIYGGAGNDVITAGDGADKFYFSSGDGSDTISSAAANDVIYIAGADAPTSVSLAGDDLTINYGSGDSIVVNGYKGLSGAINTIKYGDGYASDYDINSHLAFEIGTATTSTTFTASQYGAINLINDLEADELTYTRTGATELTITGFNGENAITITGFDFTDSASNINTIKEGGVDASTITAQQIAYTTGSAFAKATEGADYKWNITPSASINISGLEAGDNINLGSGYELSRTASVPGTLAIKKGEITASVTDYNFATAVADVFTVAGATLTTDLAVTADANYGASNVFTETITLDGANRVITNLAAADTLKLPGALTTCTYDGTDVILGDGTNSAKLTLAAMETQFVINANNAVVSRAATEMAVTNTAEFDGTAYGFRYNITAVADTANTLIGGAYADTITGGNTASTLKGGAGADTINAGSAGDSIYGGADNDVITAGAGADKFYFAVGDGADTISSVGENDAIYITNEGASVAVAKSGDNLVISYGADAEHRTNSITINYDYAKTSAGAIDTIHIGAEGTFSIPENLPAFDVPLTAGIENAHTCSIFKENLTIAADGEYYVNGMKESDNIAMSGTLSRVWTAESKDILTVTNEGKVVNVTDFFTAEDPSLHKGKLNGTTIYTAGTELSVALDADYETAYACDNTFYETIGGTGSVTGFDAANDKIFAAELENVEITRTNNSYISISGITVDNNTNAITITDGNDSISSTDEIVEVTLTDALNTDTYVALASYEENISLSLTSLTSVKVSGLSADDNLDIESGYTLSRTASVPGTLAITKDGKTVNVTDYDFTEAVADVFTVADATLTTDLAVTADADYTATDIFTETITTSGDITITGLAAADSVVIGNGEEAAALSRTASSDNLTLTTTSQGVITLVDYFDGANEVNATVGGAGLFGRDLAVTADDDYAADDNFAETITMSDAHSLSGLSDSDKLSVATANKYVKDGDNLLVKADDTTLATITDIETNNGFTVKASGDENYVALSTKTLTVSTASNFDASEGYWGFGTFDITGTAADLTLKGYSGADTITAAAAGSSIYGMEGNDTLVGGDGADKFYFASGDGADTLTAGETDAIYITDEGASVAVAKSGDNLVISYGEDEEHLTNTITITNYDFTKIVAGAIDTIHIGAEGTFYIPGALSPAIDVILHNGDNHTCSIFDENISIESGSATVSGMKEDDSISMGEETTTLSRIWSAEDGAKLTLTDTASGAITINGYFDNYYGKFNDGAMPTDLAVTLAQDTPYVPDDNFVEKISGNGTIAAASIPSGGDDQLWIANAEFTRTNTGNTLVVSNNTNSVTVTGFNYGFEEGEPLSNIAVNDGGTADMLLNVTLTADLTDHEYAATDYTENISVTDETNIVTITGLTPDDNLDLNNTYALSRTASSATLTITDGDVRIAIPEFDFTASREEMFTVADAELTNALAVNVDCTYYASDEYAETITMSGANSLYGLKDVDKLNVPTATTFEKSGDWLLVKAGDTALATIKDIKDNHEFTVKASGDGDFVELSDKTLTVNTGVNFDASVEANRWGFGAFNITGMAEGLTLKGYTGDDTIAAAGGSTLYGNGGNDTFVFADDSGSNVIKDANLGDTIKMLVSDHSVFTDITFEKSGTKLVASNGENSSVEIQGYFDNNGDAAADHVNQFSLKSAGGETAYTLEWKQSNVDDESNMYNVIDGNNANNNIEAVAGIRNWINSGAGADIILGKNVGDMLAGNSGNDTITTHSAKSEIYGGEDNDTIVADGGSSFIVGGSGNDGITVGGENNVICVVNTPGEAAAREFGIDTLAGATSTDTLKFSLGNGDGYEFSELRFEKSGDNLLITASAGNTLTVNGFFTAGSKVDKIVAFDDEGKQTEYSIMNDAEIVVDLTGTDEDHPYVPNPNYREIFIGSGYVADADFTNDKFVMTGDTAYTLNADGLTIAADQTIHVLGNTSANVNVYVDDEPDDISAKTLNVSGLTDFDGTESGFGKYNITGTDAPDTLTIGNGDFEFNTINGGAGDDELTGGEGEDHFVFNGDFGHDTITNATSDDEIIVDVPFNNLVFSRPTDGQGNKTDALLISTGNPDNDITIADYYAQKRSDRINTINDEEFEYFDPDDVIDSAEIQADGGKYVVDKDNVDDLQIIASDYVSTSAKGVTITNNTDTSVDFTGSVYNDTVKFKNGDNSIVENGGKNTITTGAGDDYVEAQAYSSNTFNLGAGENEIVLNSFGTNKVTAGKDDDYLEISNGSNRASLGAGDNVIGITGGSNTVTATSGDDGVTIDGGINTVNAGNGSNEIAITNGVNKINTGSGNDTYNIDGGNNTINSGSAATPYNDQTFEGADQFIITGGYNTIKSSGYSAYDIQTGAGVPGVSYVNNITTGSKEDIFWIAAGTTNNISSGAGNDIFDIDGGNNNINAGSGIDEFVINGGNNNINAGSGNDVIEINGGTNAINLGAGNDEIFVNAGTNTLTDDGGNDTYHIVSSITGTLIDRKGNDTYDLSAYAGGNDIVINDQGGKNTLALNGLKDFFVDVTLGKKGKFTVDNEFTFNGINGHNLVYTGKDSKSISNVIVGANEYKFDASVLAQEVAGWMVDNGYEVGTTASDIINSATDPNAAVLAQFYVDHSADCYQQLM